MRVIFITTIQCLNMPGSSIRNRICLIINYYHENRLLPKQAPRGEQFHALSQLHATEFTSFVVHNTPVSSTALSNLLDLHIFILKYQVSLCIYYFWIVHMCINYTWSYIWCILIILLSIKLSYSFLFSLNSFLFLISLFFTFVSPSFFFLVHQWI